MQKLKKHTHVNIQKHTIHTLKGFHELVSVVWLCFYRKGFEVLLKCVSIKGCVDGDDLVPSAVDVLQPQ